MNKIIYKVIFIVLAILCTAEVMAQVPQGFNFQAVARDAEGELIKSATLGVKISVLKGGETGTAVYTETQTPLTNEIGMFQLVIGEGTSEDDFQAIDWSLDNYYVKLEIDPAGGTKYEELGVTRLLSVPYALLSQNVVNGVSAGEELITDYHLNSSQGDTSFQVTISGNEGRTAFIGLANTSGVNVGVEGKAHSSSGNTALNVGTYGEALGSGTGSHLGLYGIAMGEEGVTGSRFGVYGVAEGFGRYNFGIRGSARGPGDGNIVPLGEGSVETGYGSYNIAGGFYSHGNLNGNVGVEGDASGSEAARNYMGVIGRAHGTNHVPNVGIRGEAFGSTLVNVALEGDANGTFRNIGLRVSAYNGTSNIGIESNADTAAILNGKTVVNGDLIVNGTINSGDSGSASPTQEIAVENAAGDWVAVINSHGTNNMQGFIHLYGQTAIETDNLRAALEVSDNGAGDSWGNLRLHGPGSSQSYVNASVSNDPGGNDPTGWSGMLDLWGSSSPNIHMGSRNWEDSNLPEVTLYGNIPTVDGWFYNHVNFAVHKDGEQQWGVLHLMANDGVSNIEMGGKNWEDPSEGAGRPYMVFRGNTDTDAVWMDVIEDESGVETGSVLFRSSNGTAEFGMNAYGIFGSGALNWSNDLNIDAGNLYVNGNITYTGTSAQTSDRNLKENIKPLQDGLATIMQLNPTTYEFRGDGFYKGMRLSTGMHYGLIAQEVENVLPALVSTNIHTYSETVNTTSSGPATAVVSDNEITMEYKTLNYTELIPVLIKAVQEQQAEIERLKSELKKLKK